MTCLEGITFTIAYLASCQLLTPRHQTDLCLRVLQQPRQCSDVGEDVPPSADLRDIATA